MQSKDGRGAARLVRLHLWRAAMAEVAYDTGMRVATRVILVFVLILSGSGPIPGQHGPGQSASVREAQPAVSMRGAVEAIARMERRLQVLADGDDEIRAELRALSTQLRIVKDKVDKPLISELWFGFVSDRFNWALKSMLGWESGASQPLWTAGILSLGLLLIKTLSLFLTHSRPESALAKHLGTAFGWLVSLYLIVLTGSLFLLATTAPGSAVDGYKKQVETSDKLTRLMEANAASTRGLITQLSAVENEIRELRQMIGTGSMHSAATQNLSSADPGSIAKLVKCSESQSAALAELRAQGAELNQTAARIRDSQPSTLWKITVGLGGFIIIGVAFFGAYQWLKDQ
jgi:hypothetical protein